MNTSLRSCCFCIVVLTATVVHAQTVYKYRDGKGHWAFSDHPPAKGGAVAVQTLAVRPEETPTVTVKRIERGGSARLLAGNSCYCPAEVLLQITTHRNARITPGVEVRQVIPARSSAELVALTRSEPGTDWSFDYRYRFVLGDPHATHHPARPYRPPFAPAGRYQVSQAYPDTSTHDTPASRYAVDIAMPEQSGVYAARGGVVIAVSHTHYRGGADRLKFGRQANIVEILHDDGTFALYAHLSWDSIRVRPGQRVKAGEYIANSGNTGFTTGPHLHFVVLRNRGLEQVSVPVSFAAANGAVVTPRTGDFLQSP